MRSGPSIVPYIPPFFVILSEAKNPSKLAKPEQGSVKFQPVPSANLLAHYDGSGKSKIKSGGQECPPHTYAALVDVELLLV